MHDEVFHFVFKDEAQIPLFHGFVESPETQDEVLQDQHYFLGLGIDRIEDDETAVILALKYGLVFLVVITAHHAHAQFEAIEFVAALAPLRAVVIFEIAIGRRRSDAVGAQELALVGLQYGCQWVEHDFGLSAVENSDFENGEAVGRIT